DMKKYSVDEAANGLEAIENVQKNGTYDVIFMDIQMRRMDGVVATQTLRKKFHYHGIIIGLTGYVDQDSFNRFLEAGMTHVISKPVDKQILYMYADKYGTTVV